jgi:hypothetical protein
MATLGMNGPFKLDKETIEREITRTSPGNYALGHENEKGTFLVNYVGRADSDVKVRLKSWVSKTSQPLFKFIYAASAKAAFEKECENYHDFDPPANDTHPDRPDGTNWKCPRCGVFDQD